MVFSYSLIFLTQQVDLLKEPKLMASATEGGSCEVLDAAAWLVGEFSQFVP